MKAGDVVALLALGGGVDMVGTPNIGVDTVRGETYNAEADTGGVGRESVRRAVERMGESPVEIIEDRFEDTGDRFTVGDSGSLD
jgi:hypothetical protein